MTAEDAPTPPTLLHTLFASSLAGLVARAPCHPIDTVKSRLQAASGARYSGIWHCVRLTFAEEGLRGFYRGLGAVAVVGTPAACLYISSYEVLKRWLSPDGSELRAVGHLSAGMGAEAMACALFVPVDVVKERLQVQSSGSGAGAPKAAWAPPAYSGSFDAIRVISRTEGLLGLYKGYWVTLASFGPFSALYFMFYEKARAFAAHAEGKPGSKQLSAVGTLCSSAFAGCTASVLTNPLEVAKLRLQTQRRLAAGEAIPDGHLQGMAHAMRTIHSEGGLRAFLRGAWARSAFHIPSTCITFTCFEECKKLAQRFF